MKNTRQLKWQKETLSSLNFTMDLEGEPGKIIRGKLNHLQIAPFFFQPVAMKDRENASKLNEIHFSRNIHNLDALQDV